MNPPLLRMHNYPLQAALLILLSAALPPPARALTPGQFEDFQDGTIQGWTSRFGTTQTSAVADAGPAGIGDYALEVAFSQKAVVYNELNYRGDWTAAGLHDIEFAMLSPTENATDLTLWLGISAMGEPGPGGSGDTYVTLASQSVPSDGLWHTVSFDVTASGWGDWGGNDVVNALTDVAQLRIVHSATRDFIGAPGITSILIDTPAQVPEPATLAVGLISLAAGGWVYRCRASLS